MCKCVFAEYVWAYSASQARLADATLGGQDVPGALVRNARLAWQSVISKRDLWEGRRGTFMFAFVRVASARPFLSHALVPILNRMAGPICSRSGAVPGNDAREWHRSHVVRFDVALGDRQGFILYCCGCVALGRLLRAVCG